MPLAWLGVVVIATAIAAWRAQLPGTEPAPYIIKFTEDRPNPLYRRICYTFAWSAVVTFAVLNITGLVVAVITGEWRLRQMYDAAYFPIAGTLWTFGAFGLLPRVKWSTQGEGHERRYFYGSVWAVTIAQPILGVLWKTLPASRAADGAKLAAFIGVLAGIVAQSYWTRIQLFLHGGSFGITDPQFGMDLGFYAFELPQTYEVLAHRLVDFWRVDIVPPLAVAWNRIAGTDVLTYDDGEMSIEDLVDDKELVIVMTEAQYVKSVPASAFIVPRTNSRGEDHNSSPRRRTCASIIDAVSNRETPGTSGARRRLSRIQSTGAEPVAMSAPSWKASVTESGACNSCRARVRTSDGSSAWYSSHCPVTSSGARPAAASRDAGSRASGSRRPETTYRPSRRSLDTTTTPGSARRASR